jgi:hypothetical protein
MRHLVSERKNTKITQPIPDTFVKQVELSADLIR